MKSHEQDLLLVCRSILMDAAAKCYTDIVSIRRDLITIRSRLSHESVSFVTITLPTFGKEFEKALDRARITASDFQGWKKRMCLPAFLQGFTRLVFDAGTGELLDDPDIAAIEGIRQIAYSFKKLSLQCTPERECKALSGYKEVECILSDAVPSGDADLFNQVSRLLWGNVLNEQYDCSQYIPRHGPGQTAERISGNRKYAHRSWHERLEPFFPSDLFLMSCYTQLDDVGDGIEGVQYVVEENELPVRVVLVPKTLKGPRIIAIEPVCMQYAQQALASYLIRKLESHWITGGHLNFSDQTINQRLAVSASSDQSLATIDLSEASDRVSLSLVSDMLSVHRDFHDAVMACRSQAAQLPTGEILNLKKFASMGSALCFPVEAMFFFTLITCALLKRQELPVTLRNISNVTRSVYVYGDDIIIPVDEVEIVTETLTSFNCKVNTDKSFWTGKFRESCGMDAFDGCEVTPTYIHHFRPSNKGQVAEIASLIATSNLLYKKGYWLTASLFKDWIEELLGQLPVIKETSPGLGWHSYQNGFNYDTWNRVLHRFEINTYVLRPVYQNDPLDGWSALLKFFLSSALRPSFAAVDEDHLSRSPRSGTSSMKRRRTTPY